MRNRGAHSNWRVLVSFAGGRLWTGKAPCLSIGGSLFIWMPSVRQGHFLKGLRGQWIEVIRGSFGGRSGEVQGSFGVVRRSFGSRSRFVRKFFEKFFEKFSKKFSKNFSKNIIATIHYIYRELTLPYLSLRSNIGQTMQRCHVPLKGLIGKASTFFAEFR